MAGISSSCGWWRAQEQEQEQLLRSLSRGMLRESEAAAAKVRPGRPKERAYHNLLWNMQQTERGRRARVSCQSVAGRGWGWGAAVGPPRLMMMLSDLHRLPGCLVSPRQQLVDSTRGAIFTFPKWKVFFLPPHLIWPTATDATTQNKTNKLLFLLLRLSPVLSACFLIENEN